MKRVSGRRPCRLKAIYELEQAAKTTDKSEAAEMLAKAAEYRARVGVLQQKAQMDKMAAMASGAQLAQQGAQMAHEGQQAVATAGGYTTMAGAAAVGAAAGFVVMGPVTAVAAAGAAAYATTRKDTAGDVARSTGTAAAGPRVHSPTPTRVRSYTRLHSGIMYTRGWCIRSVGQWVVRGVR